MKMMIRNQVVDPLFPQCPVRNVLSRIGDRWSLLVLLALHDKAEAMRFSDLCKAIPDVSQKMLTSTLRKLEADDLLSRTIYPEVPPRVEYKLTKRGKTLIPLLNQLVDWSLDNMDAIMRHRKKYAL
jgi:DNA-binding HxlR family transcriptional regulator